MRSRSGSSPPPSVSVRSRSASPRTNRRAPCPWATPGDRPRMSRRAELRVWSTLYFVVVRDVPVDRRRRSAPRRGDPPRRDGGAARARHGRRGLAQRHRDHDRERRRRRRRVAHRDRTVPRRSQPRPGDRVWAVGIPLLDVRRARHRPPNGNPGALPVPVGGPRRRRDRSASSAADVARSVQDLRGHVRAGRDVRRAVGRRPARPGGVGARSDDVAHAFARRRSGRRRIRPRDLAQRRRTDAADRAPRTDAHRPREPAHTDRGGALFRRRRRAGAGADVEPRRPRPAADRTSGPGPAGGHGRALERRRDARRTPAGQIQYASPGLFSTLGHRGDDWIGRPIIDLVASDDRDASAVELQRVLATRTREHREVRGQPRARRRPARSDGGDDRQPARWGRRRRDGGHVPRRDRAARSRTPAQPSRLPRRADRPRQPGTVPRSDGSRPPRRPPRDRSARRAVRRPRRLQVGQRRARPRGGRPDAALDRRAHPVRDGRRATHRPDSAETSSPSSSRTAAGSIVRSRSAETAAAPCCASRSRWPDTNCR